MRVPLGPMLIATTLQFDLSLPNQPVFVGNPMSGIGTR